MKKQITLLAALMAFATFGFGQASLPTSYDFNSFSSAASLPAGWTTNITGTFTYAIGQAGTAGKVDQQGEYVQIFTQDPMGTTTFYLKGWIGGGPTSWSGTFTVEESVNG
ncbi:MAG: hypothetical protein IAF38_13905, partial [Bacteroidia bacterium]|nr:hypothetical protein [Bacteroidia bacterium]